MYEVTLSEEARATTTQLPRSVLTALAELVDALAINAELGRPYRGSSSDLRTIAIAGGQLLVVWLVLENQHRVELLRLLWLGDADRG